MPKNKVYNNQRTRYYYTEAKEYGYKAYRSKRLEKKINLVKVQYTFLSKVNKNKSLSME